MAKKSEDKEQIGNSLEVDSLRQLVESLAAQVGALTRNLEESKKDVQIPEAPKETAAPKESGKGITLQHIKPLRQWTVAKSRVLKIHRGTGTVNNPRFEGNIVLTPGCIVTVEPKLAKELIKSRDFQKYGLEK